MMNAASSFVALKKGVKFTPFFVFFVLSVLSKTKNFISHYPKKIKKNSKNIFFCSADPLQASFHDLYRGKKFLKKVLGIFAGDVR